jgi:hypothetical protein
MEANEREKERIRWQTWNSVTHGKVVYFYYLISRLKICNESLTCIGKLLKQNLFTHQIILAIPPIGICRTSLCAEAVFTCR